MRAEERLLFLSQNPELRCKHYLGSVRWEHAVCKACRFFPKSSSGNLQTRAASTAQRRKSRAQYSPHPSPASLLEPTSSDHVKGLVCAIGFGGAEAGMYVLRASVLLVKLRFWLLRSTLSDSGQKGRAGGGGRYS